MNVIELQNKIISEPDLIQTILVKLGHTNINDRGHYFQTSNLDGDNLTAISILKKNLFYSNFTRGEKGDIFTLVMSEKNCSFPDAIRKISKWIDYKEQNYYIKKPFGGFYEKIIRSECQPELDMKTYSESALPPPDNLSLKWVKDGVSLQVQEKYGIRYDHETNGIIIPAYNYDDKLVGAKWRNNDDCSLSERWGMYIPYAKSNILWGYNQHYKNIKSKQIAIVVEAEKSVMQAESFNCNLCLSIGGHSFSSTQIRYLKSLMCKKIIVAFDEGLHKEEIEYEANKLKTNNNLYDSQIGYIYDEDNKYLEKNSKNSPTDLGKEIFEKIMKECIIWI